jgi:hypothetical protein
MQLHDSRDRLQCNGINQLTGELVERRSNSWRTDAVLKSNDNHIILTSYRPGGRRPHSSVMHFHSGCSCIVMLTLAEIDWNRKWTWRQPNWKLPHPTFYERPRRNSRGYVICVFGVAQRGKRTVCMSMFVIWNEVWQLSNLKLSSPCSLHIRCRPIDVAGCHVQSLDRVGNRNRTSFVRCKFVSVFVEHEIRVLGIR